MNHTSLVERTAAILRELTRLAGECAGGATEAAAGLRAERRSVDEDFAASREAIERSCESESQQIDEQWRSATQETANRFDSQRKLVERDRDTTIERGMHELEAAEREAQATFKETAWLSRTVYETKLKRATQEWHDAKRVLQGQVQQIGSLRHDAATWLARAGQQRVVEQMAERAPHSCDDPHPREGLARAQAAAAEGLMRLRGLWVTTVAKPGVLVTVIVAVAAAAVLSLLLSGAMGAVPSLALGSTLAVAAGTPLAAWIWRAVCGRVSDAYRSFLEETDRAEAAARQCANDASAEFTKKSEELRRHFEAEQARATSVQAAAMAVCQERREVELPGVAREADERLVQLAKVHDDARRAADARRDADRAAARVRRDTALGDLESIRAHSLAGTDDEFEQANEEFLNRWRGGVAAARAELELVQAMMDEYSPGWAAVASSEFDAPQVAPPTVRIGGLRLALRTLFRGPVPAAWPADAVDGELVLPGLLDLDSGASVCVKLRDGDRAAGSEILHAAMYRLLSDLPPGQIRMTIVDPVGLGASFAEFMHLADFNEALVGQRIVTEPAQIEAQLGTLVEHVETIIQNRLRNEFATLRDYNSQAGAMAEPVRVVVVANFPAGFTETAARRLIRLAASGARCGVHVLCSVDETLPAIKGLDRAEFERHATVLEVRAKQVTRHGREQQCFRMVADVPAQAIRPGLLEAIGRRTQAAERIEVPLETIAPAADEYWTADTRYGIEVPLGREDASRLQFLRLGQGTSQHVLVAGKTGSGKSTLLHALILNAALRYSPDELELYLIDFKKGVEFKTYATHHLPHARVIAIESEREFGLGVIERLDEEMGCRGELFRAAGVHDIAAYRDAGHALPRVLLVIDEFQEFFVEDDKIAQEAALLLDRLVRQGRAFGIHVHLGSQTLSGAYSLARSTLGQIAVRIALQCSEADSQVILHEENSAARLLSRPGEAILNDANGLIEGNRLFQVAWVSDESRERYLRVIEGLAARREAPQPRELVVFEGSQPATVEAHRGLNELLVSSGRHVASAPRVWLGEPLALRAASPVEFPRRSGANLLWIGQNPQAVAGTSAAAMLALAAQARVTEGGAECGVAPITIVNAAGHEAFERLGREMCAQLPGLVQTVTANEAADVVARLAAEVERRVASGESDAPPLFLVVLDLARCRELRRVEDDFSFSRKSEAERPRPDRQFEEILRAGPAVGVHALVWCDTSVNFKRMLDRTMLTEFETRVLFQMSAADSILLLDSPAASQLGPHRAILHGEEQGRVERFRPFAMPAAEWLARACEAIGRRVLNETADTAACTTIAADAQI